MTIEDKEREIDDLIGETGIRFDLQNLQSALTEAQERLDNTVDKIDRLEELIQAEEE